MTSPGTEVRTPPPSASPPGRGPSAGTFTGRALILALVAGTLLLSLAVPVRAWFSQRSEIAGLRADVDAARDRVAALEVQKQRWDDPAFVAAEARRRLHFVLPGEVGFVALGTEGTTDDAVVGEGPEAPWYSSLWGALQAADDSAGSTEK